MLSTGTDKSNSTFGTFNVCVNDDKISLARLNYTFDHRDSFALEWQWLWLSISRAIAPDIRDARFKSSHRQNFIYQLYNRKDKNKEKEAGNGSSLKKYFL